MAEYTIDKIEYDGNVYKLQDNISGYIKNYTETDPVFSASAAAGITTSDITNWNNKVSDDKTWNGVTLNNSAIVGTTIYIPGRASISATNAYNLTATTTPTSKQIALYDGSAYLYSTTPSTSDNSTKVATTAYVDAAIGAISIPTKTSQLTNDSGFSTTDEKLKITPNDDLTTLYPILSSSISSTPEAKKYDTSFAFTDFSSSWSWLSIGSSSVEGTIRLYSGTSGAYTNIAPSVSSGAITLTLPNITGTVALTSDIPTIPTVPTITLNGSSTTSPSFYAPTSAGTSGQVLQSSGSGEPAWITPSSNSQTTWFGTSSTTASTAAKVVTCEGFTLATGAIIGILFSTGNTADEPTLNINSTGSKNIVVGNITVSSTNVLKWSANTVLYFQYNGTNFYYINSVSAASEVSSRGAGTWYGTSSTTAATTAKVVTCSNFVLTKGSLISVRFTYASTADTLTLNVNSTGAKTVYRGSGSVSSTNPLKWDAYETLTFIYDGSYYRYVSSSSSIDDLVVGEYSSESKSIAANNNYTDDVTITKTGYTPIAIVGWNTIQTSGANVAFFNIVRLYLSAASSGTGTVTIAAKNLGTSSMTAYLTFYVLWKKD